MVRVLAVPAVILGLGIGSADAATFTVVNLDDSGPGVGQQANATEEARTSFIPVCRSVTNWASHGRTEPHSAELDLAHGSVTRHAISAGC